MLRSLLASLIVVNARPSYSTADRRETLSWGTLHWSVLAASLPAVDIIKHAALHHLAKGEIAVLHGAPAVGVD